MPKPAKLLDLRVIEQKLLDVGVESRQSGITPPKNTQKKKHFFIRLKVVFTKFKRAELCLHRVIIIGNNAWGFSSGWISKAGIVDVAEDALNPRENPCRGQRLVGEMT